MRTYKHRTVDEMKWNPGDSVTGTITGFETIKVGKEDRESVIIDTGTILARVWRSDGLAEVFDQGKPGDHVNVEFREKKPLKGGHSFNVFGVQLWTEESDVENQPAATAPPVGKVGP